MAKRSEREEFAAFLKEKAPFLKNFSVDEVLVKVNNVHNGVRNKMPPKELWPNIIPTLLVVQRLRTQLGRRIKVLSVYRHPEYNSTIPGAAKNSYHTKFMAMDITSPDMSAAQLYNELMRMRRLGQFKGGVALYSGSNFVHVDTRGKNADWG